MSYKWIGAIMIIVSCGGFGFTVAAMQLREERSLRQLIAALDYMECELQYRLTPLPDLCFQVSEDAKGSIREVFRRLSEELEAQVSPDVECCMQAVLANNYGLPLQTLEALRLLGQTLGRFDLPGQLKGLETVRTTCRKRLEALTTNKEPRLRSYQTLGICAGAALAILFL